MKPALKKRDSWRCDRCGQKTDTLYFATELNICGDCREEDRRRSQWLNARSDMHAVDIARVGAPEVILPGDGVLEGCGYTVRLRRDMSLEAHETSIQPDRAGLAFQPSTRMKWNTAFL